MKFENDRSRRMAESGTARIDRIEAYAQKIRARLEKEMEILTKHEIALSRKETRGTESEVTRERLEKKREQIAALEFRVNEMEGRCQALRDQIRRVVDFHPLQDQLDGLPQGFRRAGEGEWKIPNSRFKTFQDVFTPPEARVIPEGKRLNASRDYDRLPLRACPVDPARVPDWLMKEFSLGNLEGLDSFEKLEVKVKAIPELRDIFRHLVPMEAYGKHTHRVMTLQGYAPDHDGKIFIASYSGREKEDKDRKHLQLFDSAYEAERRSLYVNRQYHNEQAKLHGIKARVRQSQAELIGMRAGDPKKQEIEKRLADELEILGHVTNFHKVQAADILRDVLNIKDSLGRHNPGAACARMVRALNQLNNRLPQIFEKSPRVMDDSRTLGVQISQGKEALDGSYEGFLALCRGLEKGEWRSGTERRLQQIPGFRGLTVRPFNQYAAKLTEKKALIARALKEGDMASLHFEALSAYVAAKTFRIQHEREMILRDIAASPMETGIDALLARSKRLMGAVTSKETLKELRIGGHEPYREMAGKIMTLVRGLEAYQRRNLSETERIAMYERLKKFLEEIDFTEILEKL